MDSSRSGLLSTLLMTLPLIVVPAIALLRPPGQTVGVSTTSLDAASLPGDDLPDEFQVAGQAHGETREPQSPSTQEYDDGFGGLFAEPGEDNAKKPAGGRTSGSRETADPFNPFDEPVETPNSKESPRNQLTDRGNMESGEDGFRVVPTNLAESIVEQLTVQGAVRTMWFDAGDKSPVGFAAFFRGQTELMRIRFEAVGQSREECARNVLDQVTRWQAEQAEATSK